MAAEFVRTTRLPPRPPGADVSYRDYAAQDAPWTHLGKSPLKRVTLPQGVYRWKIEKAGFVTHECVVAHSFDVRLQEEGTRSEMVWMSGWKVGLPGAVDGKGTTVEVPPYLIDRYEVTNEKFRKFVDAGGYENPRFWQGLPFEKEGRQLSLKEALSKFHDETGLPGPKTWANGTYPPGRGQHPVSGVSWYEAVALRHVCREEPANG